MPNSYQVKFYKGNVTDYNTNRSQYSGGIFFDTTNKDIYLNGDKYTEGRFMLIDDVSVISAAGNPYIILDYTSNLGQSSMNAVLPRVDGSNAIDVSLNHDTNNFTVKLLLNNTNGREWFTQDSSGLKFDETILYNYIRQGIAGDMIYIDDDGEINHQTIDVSLIDDTPIDIDFETTNTMRVVGSVEYDNYGHIIKLHPVDVAFEDPASYWHEID